MFRCIVTIFIILITLKSLQQEITLTAVKSSKLSHKGFTNIITHAIFKSINFDTVTFILMGPVPYLFLRKIGHTIFHYSFFNL